MPNKDHYRTVARKIKKDLDKDKLAFKTYQRDEFTAELKTVAGSGAQTEGSDTYEELATAFIQEGLIVYPPLDNTEEDGYTRVFRSGSRIAGILNAIRFPGGGSDDELSLLLGKLKSSTYQQI